MRKNIIGKFYYKIRYRLFYRIATIIKNKFSNKSESFYKEYVEQILKIPKANKQNYYKKDDTFQLSSNDPKLLAFYLPQFYPFQENNDWWGKGTTEWTNVSKAIPQFLGHDQPKLPAELGYYDLRLIDNIKSQVRLAKDHGIYGFCYYYYWFDPKRLLDLPLDLFLNNKDIDFKFCLCWANESWAKRFWGTDNTVIMEQPSSIDSYIRAIDDMLKYFKDDRYVVVNGGKLLSIYKPSNIPNPQHVISEWRRKAAIHNINLHIVGVKEFNLELDLLSLGFDAISEFQPVSCFKSCTTITSKYKYINNNFNGIVFDYKDLVINKKYLTTELSDYTYSAVMPQWDNTARKNKNATIFHGSTPDLYKQWLEDAITRTINNTKLHEPIIFINAWNEWGEGAYLEPDRKYGYEYLTATLEAIKNTRQ